MLVSARVLAHYNPSLSLQLVGDASAYGMGAVNSHIYPDGSERRIAFASRHLPRASEIMLSWWRRRLVLWCLEFENSTTIYMAEISCCTLITSSIGNHPGIQGTNPTTSCCPTPGWAMPATSNTADNAAVFNICEVHSLPVTASQLRWATKQDPVISAALRFTWQGWPNRIRAELKPYFCRRIKILVEGECLMWGIRVTVPERLRARVMDELHENHPGMAKAKSLARGYVWWPSLDAYIEEMTSSCVCCQMTKVLLH